MPHLNWPTTETDTTLPPSERRAAIRCPAGREGTCRPALDPSAHPVPAWWADISMDGIGLIVEQPFEPRTLLVLELDGEVNSALRLRLARVRYLTRWGKKRWWLGCTLSTALTQGELQAFVGGGEPTPGEEHRRGTSEGG